MEFLIYTTIWSVVILIFIYLRKKIELQKNKITWPQLFSIGIFAFILTVINIIIKKSYDYHNWLLLVYFVHILSPYLLYFIFFYKNQNDKENSIKHNKIFLVIYKKCLMFFIFFIFFIVSLIYFVMFDGSYMTPQAKPFRKTRSCGCRLEHYRAEIMLYNFVSDDPLPKKGFEKIVNTSMAGVNRYKCPLNGIYEIKSMTPEVIVECSIHGTLANPKIDEGYDIRPWWKFWNIH